MNISNKIENFYKRWDIPYNKEKKFNDFKNRVLNTIDLILGEKFLDNKALENEYIKIIAKHSKEKTTQKVIYSPPFTVVDRYFKTIVINFSQTKVYNILQNINDLVELIKCLEVLFYFDFNTELKKRLYEELKKDIEYSSIDVEIKEINGDLLFYPKGAKLLDEKVVNDVLDWLAKFPKSYKSFESALKKYQEKKYVRNLIDDLRVSMELLLKKILHNSKNLENQISELGNYLRGGDVPKEIGNMYTKLVDYYSKYQNEYAKHDDKVKESEIEFIIYLTGTFMRFLMILETSNR